MDKLDNVLYVVLKILLELFWLILVGFVLSLSRHFMLCLHLTYIDCSAILIVSLSLRRRFIT